MLNANGYFSLSILSRGFGHNLIVQKLATKTCDLVDGVINRVHRTIAICAGRMLIPIAADQNHCGLGHFSGFKAALQGTQFIGVQLFFRKLLFLDECMQIVLKDFLFFIRKNFELLESLVQFILFQVVS